MTDEPEFAHLKPQKAPPKVSDIQIISGNWNGGLFQTKSGGTLQVNFGIPLHFLPKDYFSHDETETALIERDIAGLRSYSVNNLVEEIKGGKNGGAEFHRIRKEIVLASAGEIVWDCEDAYGNKRTISIEHFASSKEHTGIFIPPFILHTYQVRKVDVKTETAGLVVIANTLFDYADELTHDTYSVDSFKKLQLNYKP